MTQALSLLYFTNKMPRLVESGFETTEVLIDYAPRRLVVVQQIVSDQWTGLLKGQPKDYKPQGLLFAFRGFLGYSSAIVRGDSTKIITPVAHQEEAIGEIADGILSRKDLQVESITTSKSTHLHLYGEPGESVSLNQALKQLSPNLTPILSAEIGQPVRRMRSTFYFLLEGSRYSLRLATLGANPPVGIICAVSALTEKQPRSNQLGELFDQQNRILRKMADIVPESISLN